MKANTLNALHLEIPVKEDLLAKTLLLIQQDALAGAEDYVKSAKVDLGGE